MKKNILKSLKINSSDNITYLSGSNGNKYKLTYKLKPIENTTTTTLPPTTTTTTTIPFTCLSKNISVTVTDGEYYFNGLPGSLSKFSLTNGTYIFNNIPSGHPIAFHTYNKLYDANKCMEGNDHSK